jgi:transcriptional regulator MftR-like protein
LKAAAVTQREVAQAIAERTGTDAERDLYPRLVAAAIGAATHVANEHWVRANPPVPLLVRRPALIPPGADRVSVRRSLIGSSAASA